MLLHTEIGYTLGNFEIQSFLTLRAEKDRESLVPEKMKLNFLLYNLLSFDSHRLSLSSEGEGPAAGIFVLSS